MSEKNIGRYRILEKLGEGGMGSVWRAEDPILGRSVAIKFLPESLADDPDARRRFLREARTASILNHSGIAAIYDAGEAEGQVYIAMHLVEGETVSQRVARTGPFPIGEAVAIARDAASALGHAHANDVIHRDVTARNIMVGADGHVFVVDFGLALALGLTRLTTAGTTMGTAGYMAPEVIRGGTADARSDLYGLGVVLYEMLTGRTPFDGERPEAVLYAAVNKLPEPPRSLRTEISEPLERIVLALLEKDPVLRYQRAQELEADLQSFLRGEPPQNLPASRHDVTVTLPPVSRNEIARPPASTPIPPGATPGTPRPASPLTSGARLRAGRARRLIPVLAGLALLAAGTTLAMLYFGRGGSVPIEGARLAVLPLQNLSPRPEESAHIARAIGASLTTRLGRIGLAVIPWVTSERYADENRLPADIAKELGVQMLVMGTFQSSEDRIQVNLSLVDPKTGLQAWAEEFDARSSETPSLVGRLAASAAQQLKPRLTHEDRATLERQESRNAAALDAFAHGQIEMTKGGRAAFAQAFMHFQKAVELDSTYAEAFVGLGGALTGRFYHGWAGSGSLQEAEQAFRRALALDPQLHSARGGLARIYLQSGRSEAALQLIEDARLNGVDSPDKMFAIGEALVFAGFMEKAATIFHRILEHDPQSAGAQYLLVVCQVFLGNWDAVIQEAEKYFSMVGPDQELLGVVGWAYGIQGELEDAKLYVDRSLQMGRDEDANPENFGYAGEIYRRLEGTPNGNVDETNRIFRRGLSQVESRLALHPDNYRMRMQRVWFLAALGDAQGSGKESEAMLKDFHGNGGMAAMLAMVYARIGERTRALELFRTAIEWGALNMGDFWGLSGASSDPVFRSLILEYQKALEQLERKYLAAPL